MMIENDDRCSLPLVSAPLIEKCLVDAQDGFDPTSFLSFTAWYEKKHNLKLGADPAELTKLMAAFKTIQDALSL